MSSGALHGPRHGLVLPDGPFCCRPLSRLGAPTEACSLSSRPRPVWARVVSTRSESRSLSAKSFSLMRSLGGPLLQVILENILTSPGRPMAYQPSLSCFLLERHHTKGILTLPRNHLRTRRRDRTHRRAQNLAAPPGHQGLDDTVTFYFLQQGIVPGRSSARGPAAIWLEICGCFHMSINRQSRPII